MSEFGVGLIDLGPPEFSVKIRGKTHVVYGLSALSVFDLIKQYPEIQSLMEKQFKDITPERLMQIGPIVAFRIMAMGLLDRSMFVDEKAWVKGIDFTVKQLVSVSMAEQLDLLDAVLQATMPQGADPFIARLNQLKARFRPELPATSAPSTNSQEPSSQFQEDARIHGVRPLDS